MPELIYEGHVDPDAVPLTLDYHPRLRRQETAYAPDAMYEVTVFVGRIRVRVTTETVNSAVAHDLFLPAWEIASKFVEAAGFIRAIPYSVALERVIFPDGEMKQFALGDRSLAAVHDFSEGDLEAISDVSFQDLKVGLLLSDILMTLGKSDYSPIACGRVADSIARLIAPEENRAQQWARLRETLRVDEAFVRSLSDVSKASRHGDRIEVDAKTNNLTAHRAWALVGRYMRFRLDGPLDPIKYPQLQG